ncbi:HD-GYP domain-containing protein [Caloramator sp. ALD01]|uniref:HD-GYP domain-containing protein n=1 Tax=Caloramator sp. ALD01 TaxID=1031288 RepID=UPI0003F91481|nr:HD-GYP domain-containing protein [Caloramator sp. ALD01]
MNKKVKLYLILIYSVSFLCFLNAYSTNYNNSIPGFIIFTTLATITESFPVFYRNMFITSSFAVTLAAIYSLNTFWAMVAISLSILLRIYKDNDELLHFFNTSKIKLFFNLSNLSISIFFSSKVFFLFSYFFKTEYYINELMKFILTTTTFLVVNVLIFSILISLLEKEPILKTIYENFKFGLLNIFSMAPLGYFLAYLYKNSNIVGILVVTIIILFARYTFMLYIESKTKYQETIKVLMNALEMRDKYTEGHSRNVADIVKAIGRELGYSESHIEELELAAYLHDIGKIGIPDYILNKPGKLTEEEYAKIKEHPAIGYDIVKDIKGIGNIPELVRHHHERYDGAGYPDGKKGDELSIDVYILQLADSVDAMQAKRVYKNSLNTQQIKEEVLRCRGTQFHPKVVDIYLKICERENLCNMRG